MLEQIVVVATCVHETGQRTLLSANIIAEFYNVMLATSRHTLNAPNMMRTCVQESGQKKLISANITDDDRYVMHASSGHKSSWNILMVRTCAVTDNSLRVAAFGKQGHNASLIHNALLLMAPAWNVLSELSAERRGQL